MPEHTKDKLARALREIGLDDMADKAATGYWHDFLSPLATPALDLLAKLAALRTAKANALATRVMNGEFDATQEEADDWAHSAEGKAVLRQLKQGVH